MVIAKHILASPVTLTVQLASGLLLINVYPANLNMGM